jgi:hypothetical protein
MPRIFRQLKLMVIALTLLTAQVLRADDAPPAPAAKPPITFLSVDDARTAIVDDSADPYFNKLTAHEMSAKTGRPITGDTPQAQRTECKARYQAACEEFTEEERQALTTLLGRIHPAMQRTYPGFAKQGWSFIKVKPTLEGGMPHTRGPHIIVSPPALGAMRQMANAGDVGTAAAAGLLVHEQTHVIERLHPEWFTKLFTDVFGFRRAKRIDTDPWVAARQLVNPDGIDTLWVFPVKDEAHADAKPQWICPLVIFPDPETTTLRRMSFVALELEPSDAEAPAPDTFKLKLDASGEPVHRSLPSVAAYVRSIRTRQNLYHPNEAAADLMARLAIADALDQAGAADANELEPVRSWAKETFGLKDEPKSKPGQ